jgi:hypothetical protein
VLSTPPAHAASLAPLPQQTPQFFTHFSECL